MRAAIALVALASVAHAGPIGPGEAGPLLYGDGKPPAACDKAADPIACMIDDRYAGDAKAKAIAQKLYADTGDVAGVGAEEIMDGGYRGKIHLVPELPINGYRKHLAWIASAAAKLDAFYGKQFATKQPAYRWRGLALRFVRSVKKRTPSAYALIAKGLWTVEYNVEGSLLTSERGVLETMVHELFHTNDEDHGDWSAKTLGTDYDAIVKKCGTKMSCLEPYAPNTTIVLATGTYYAFQQNNGAPVHEYAAELALRYWKEQSEMLESGKLPHKPFKCGPPENARAWKALVDEFFAGVDRVPAC